MCGWMCGLINGRTDDGVNVLWSLFLLDRTRLTVSSELS